MTARIGLIVILNFIIIQIGAQPPGTNIDHPKINFQIDPLPEPFPNTTLLRPGWEVGINGIGDFTINESFKASPDISVIIADGPIYAVRDSGYVGIGYSFTGRPTADLHVRQNAVGSNTSKGLRLSDGLTSWNIFVSPADNLVFYDDDGDLRAYITDDTGAFVITSDASLKENITRMNSVLPQIKKLNPSRYNYKNKSQKTLGFVAQEVEEVFPEVVNDSGEGIKGINYDAFGIIAIKAIQELTEKIELLEKEIAALKSE